MLLLIDAGNTQTAFALDNENDRLGNWRISSSPLRTGDEYAAFLRGQLNDSEKLLEIQDVVISSVLPGATQQLLAFVSRHTSAQAPLIVGADNVKINLEVRLPNAQEVGADRLVNAVGARELLSPPFFILDFGTATTLDYIDPHGAYAGGLIAPGVLLSANALYEAAAKLPRIDVERPKKIIGTSTVSAMKSGLFWGYVSMIEGLIARASAEVGYECLTIATGGLAPTIVGDIPAISRIEPNLTLDGLRRIHALNCDKKL